MGGAAWVAGVGGVGRALIRDAVTTLYRFSVMLDEKLFFCLQEAVSSPPLGYHHLLWPFDISQIRVLVLVRLGSFSSSSVMLLTTK